MSFSPGQNITFKPKKGKKRNGIFKQFVSSSNVMVLLDGDPFAISVKASQLSACKNDSDPVTSKEKVPKTEHSKTREEKSMTDTATKPSAKELRKTAQGLGIKGWEDMSRKEMKKAIKLARAGKKVSASSNGKSSSKPKKVSKPEKAEVSETPKAKKAKVAKGSVKKSAVKTKAPAKKVSKKAAPAKASKVSSTKTADEALGLTFAKGTPPKPLPPEGENPFRRSSNMFKIAKLLLKGGTRRSLAQKLASSAEINPYFKDEGEVDLLDYDKRLLLGAQTMRDKFGYGIQRQGRSIDGKILVFRPGGPSDPRKKKAKK